MNRAVCDLATLPSRAAKSSNVERLGVDVRKRAENRPPRRTIGTWNVMAAMSIAGFPNFPLFKAWIQPGDIKNPNSSACSYFQDHTDIGSSSPSILVV